MSFDSLFAISQSGMQAQMIRLNTTASNLSNAETVAGSEQAAYRSLHPVFAQGEKPHTEAFGDVLNEATTGVRVLGIIKSPEPIRAEYRPDNPLANEEGMVFISNVSPIKEMVDMVSASRNYQANIEVMNTSKQLLLQTLHMGQ
jgi:flagellar basal-body rod protein FlgC